MPDLSDLISRVEKASGPDDALDFEILCLVDPRALRSGPLRGDPKYTASLDAVLTLLPEGWWWSAGVCRRENHASVGSEIGTVEGELIFETFGATAPLALLAAILRAKQGAQSGQAQTEARG